MFIAHKVINFFANVGEEIKKKREEIKKYGGAGQELSQENFVERILGSRDFFSQELENFHSCSFELMRIVSASGRKTEQFERLRN